MISEVGARMPLSINSATMELLLIRHGLPLKVVNNDGLPADPPLSESGHEQARLLAEYLEGEHIDRIYSSPLRRARETALPLAKERNLEIEIEAAITEFDAESESYIPMEELKRTNPERWLEFVRGGYSDETDFDAFYTSVGQGVERIIKNNSGRRVAIFCHGGVINCWGAKVLGMKPQLFVDAIYTSINRFMAARSGERSILSLNEVPHLRESRQAAREGSR
jgi:probable phosphoglycerate mutase